MANLQQSDVIGSSWVRARAIYIDNTRGADPVVTVNMEKVVQLGDQVLLTPDSVLSETFRIQPDADGQPANIAETFPIRNTETGEILEGQTATYADLSVLLFSLVYHLANKSQE